MEIKTSCKELCVLKTIIFKSGRLEQFIYKKEGNFIVCRDMQLPKVPRVSKYEIILDKNFKDNFNGFFIKKERIR